MNKPELYEVPEQSRTIRLYEKSDWYWMDIVPPLSIEEVRELPRMACSKNVEHAPYVVMLSGGDDSNEEKTTIAYSSEVIDTDEKLEMLVQKLVKTLGSTAVSIDADE